MEDVTSEDELPSLLVSFACTDFAEVQELALRRSWDAEFQEGTLERTFVSDLATRSMHHIGDATATWIVRNPKISSEQFIAHLRPFWISLLTLNSVRKSSVAPITESNGKLQNSPVLDAYLILSFQSILVMFEDPKSNAGFAWHINRTESGFEVVALQ